MHKLELPKGDVKMLKLEQTEMLKFGLSKDKLITIIRYLTQLDGSQVEDQKSNYYY